LRHGRLLHPMTHPLPECPKPDLQTLQGSRFQPAALALGEYGERAGDPLTLGGPVAQRLLARENGPREPQISQRRWDLHRTPAPR